MCIIYMYICIYIYDYSVVYIPDEALAGFESGLVRVLGWQVGAAIRESAPKYD